MENASKALIMAASTIIAVMLFAIFVHFIKNIAIWPEAEQELLSTEQRAKFNEEYQLYYKSAMYGVDVISCLNKAASNNEKYVAGNANLSGDSFDKKYQIDVKIKINSKIQEVIEVRAVNGSLGKEVEVLGANADQKIKKTKNGANITLEEAGFKISDDLLTTWDKNTNMKYRMTSDYDSLLPNIVYSLLGNGADELKKMLNHSVDAKQTVKNKGDNKLLENLGWTQATWTTYLYNFKQKRFKCTNLEINPDTGLVHIIEFEEIDI